MRSVLLSGSPHCAAQLRAQLQPHTDSIRELEPGVFLTRVPYSGPVGVLSQSLFFARDIVPVEEVEPSRTIQIFLERLRAAPAGALLLEASELVVQVRGSNDSVRAVARKWGIQLDTTIDKTVAGRGQLARLLALELNLPLTSPQQASSSAVVLCLYLPEGTQGKFLVGLNRRSELLSPWSAGQVRLRNTTAQLSRAEHKLEESMLVLGFQPLSKGTVLDLGAAPGGWSRVLLDRGFSVVAVDPAELSPTLLRPGSALIHVRTPVAESFNALKEYAPYAGVVNDMRMPPVLSAAMTGDMASLLQRGAPVLMTLKFSEPEFASVEQVQRIMADVHARLARSGIDVLACRQLWSNRNELTLLGARRG